MRALTTTWLAVAAIGLSLTLQLSDGFYYEPALAWLGFVLIVSLLGVAGCPWPGRRSHGDGGDGRLHLRSGSGGQVGEPSLPAVLVVGVMLSAGALVTKPVARYMADPRPWEHPSFLLVVAGMTLAALIGCGARSGRGRGAAALVSLTAGIVGISLAWWRAPRTPAGFAAGLALTCLLLTAFGKKAFLNYYMLVVAALLVAIAASRGETEQELQPDDVVGHDASCLPESS